MSQRRSSDEKNPFFSSSESDTADLTPYKTGGANLADIRRPPPRRQREVVRLSDSESVSPSLLPSPSPAFLASRLSVPLPISPFDYIMAIQATHNPISRSIAYTTTMFHDEDEQAAGSDDDGGSDTSSDITELDDREIPHYFQERNGRLFHSHGGSPYPLPVDTPEQNVSNVNVFPTSESAIAPTTIPSFPSPLFLSLRSSLSYQ